MGRQPGTITARGDSTVNFGAQVRVRIKRIAGYAAPTCPASQPSMARLRVRPQ
jgi:hypothetical protein